jgi:hypothetical protein
MSKRGKVLAALIILAAAVTILVVNNDTNGPPFAPFSVTETGTSVFYDTLRFMGYPVSVGYTPLTRDSDTNYIYVLIQPHTPAVTKEAAEEMLDWVRRGGRLIFLHNNPPTEVDSLLAGIQRRNIHDFLYYNIGLGVVVTGRASPVTNQRLIQQPEPAVQLHEMISRWDGERIIFSAYYYGTTQPDNLFTVLPLVVRLTIIQSGIAVLYYLWHLGKRFGKPVPAYEETEREENEHVRALARLYTKTQPKGKKKNAENHSG